MRLKDLLIADMESYLDSRKDTVLARESIHFMISHYSNSGALTNSSLIHASQFVSFLRKVNHNAKAMHYQLVVESGERCPLNQGEHHLVHYSAADVYCNEEGHLLVVIADHYYGKEYHSYKTEYAELTDIPVHFIVLGGAPYQADSRHCPIFTLHHLLLTARDSDLLLFYRRVMSEQSTEHVTYLPWYSLSPKYLLGMQSFNYLVTYVDTVKTSEATLPEEDSVILKLAEFDKHLAESLKSNPLDMKIQNRYIEQRKESFIEEAVRALRVVSENDLIAICYEDQPVILSILKCPSDVVSAGVDQDYQHPLCPLIFSNQPLFNFLTLKTLPVSQKSTGMAQKLGALLMHRSLLCLIERGLINPQELFMQITESDSKKRVLIRSKLDSLHSHIAVMDFLAAELSRRGDELFITNNMIELIFHKNAMILVRYPSIGKCYLAGQLTNADLFALRPDKLSRRASGDFSDEMVLSTLASCGQTASPLSVSTCFSPIRSSMSPSLPSVSGTFFSLSCSRSSSPRRLEEPGVNDHDDHLDNGTMEPLAVLMNVCSVNETS